MLLFFSYAVILLVFLVLLTCAGARWRLRGGGHCEDWRVQCATIETSALRRAETRSGGPLRIHWRKILEAKDQLVILLL